MSKVTKRDNTALDKEISLLLNSCMSSSLKRRCRNQYSNGVGLPLTAWMAGARKGGHSKIIAVTSGAAKYPYDTYGRGSFEVFLRLVKNKAITDIQYLLIHQTVSSYYRGRPDVEFGDYYTKTAMYPTNSHRVFNEIYKVILSTGKTNAPLNFLLSEKLTDLILMKCLYKEVIK